MSGTQPTMADAPRSPLSPDPVSDCDKPSYSDLRADTENYDSEDDQPLKSPKSPIKKPKSDFKPKSPIEKPKAQYPANLLYGGDPPPSERQYPIKLDKDGVLRYRPEEGDFKPKAKYPAKLLYKPKSPIAASALLHQSPIKRQSPDEWPEDEDKSEDEAKLTGPSRKKAKKDKAKAKANSDKGEDSSWAKRKKAKKEKAKAKASARSLSSYKGDIDENSSVEEVGKWVLHMKGLGWCGLDCSQIFEEHNINGSDLLQMTEETLKELDLENDDHEIILNSIKTLQADKKDKAEDDLDVWDNMLRLYTGEEVKQKGLETRCFRDAWGHAHYCLKKDWKYWREPTDGRKPVILDAWAFPKPPPGSKEPPYPTPFQVYYLNTKTYALVRGEY